MTRVLLLLALTAMASGQNSQPGYQQAVPFSSTSLTNPGCKGGSACEEHGAIFPAPLRADGSGHRAG